MSGHAGGGERAAPRAVALVLTDVEGSSRIWREAPEAMLAAMTRHHELVDAVTARHGGVRPTDQGEGDSAFLAFDSAQSAVAAALELQRAVDREPWPAGARLRLRIGVGFGEVYERQGNLYGDAVNRTARVRAVAAGGQTLLSSAVRELVADHLPAQASLVDLGEHRLKDLVRPERLWQLEHPDLPADFPPLASLDAVPHNLPLQPSSFVGREADLAELVSLLDTERVVTVTGFGGIGKTRLALQAAAEVSHRLADGVWFVDCSDLGSPEQVPAVVGAALGVRDPGAGMRQAVADWLRERTALLVLDNLEQLTGIADWVHDLVASCPGLRVLSTSREPLRLRGEVDYRLEPLSTPDESARAAGLDTVSTYSSVRLFLDRARQAQRGFELTPAVAADVAGICARLDGLPLALELAAAQLRVLSPADLLVRLELGVPLPAGGERDRPERHQTLEAAIAWSLALLPATEERLLARLAVLPGSADLATISAVCAPQEELDVLGPLAALVDKSLVRRSDDGGPARFSLLSTIRDTMLARLDPQERAEVADRHLAHFLTRSVAGAASSDSPDSGPWDVEKRAELHHFRAAIARARATSRAHEQLLLVANLADIWLEQHLREGITLLERSRADAERAGVDDVALLAFAASLHAFLLAWSGDSAQGLPIADLGVRLAERPGGESVLAFAHQARSEVQPELAERHADFERALEIARRVPDLPTRWGGARAESVELGVGAALASLDRFVAPEAARAEARRLLERARGAGRTADVTGAQLLLGYLASDVGDFDAATEVLEACLAELGAAGLSQVQQLHARAQLLLVADRRDGGPQRVDELCALAAELETAGLRANAIDLLLRAGDRCHVLGDQARARTLWGQADVLCHQVGAGRTQWAGWRLARADRLAGADARDRLTAAWSDLRPYAARWLPEALSLLVEAACVAEAAGDTAGAAALARLVEARRGRFLLRLVVDDERERIARLAGAPATAAPTGGELDLPVELFGDRSRSWSPAAGG